MAVLVALVVGGALAIPSVLLAQQPPAQQPPIKATQPPATPPSQAAPAPQPPAPFPQGAKIGFVDIQRVVNESAEGKASSAKVNALVQKKQAEGVEKNKQLQANQQKLQQSGGVLSDAARGQLEKEIERQQVESQRFQQDAQSEINELTQELQNEFIKKVRPVLQQVATEKGLHALFNADAAGVAWADPGLDLTTEVVKKLDAGASKPAGAPKQ
jgi:outer membrane protein